MLTARSVVRTWSLFALFGAAACSGSASCGGCTGLTPIPGGFDQTAQIEHAAQVRLSRHGFDFIQSQFPALIGAYAGLKCGQPDDVPCPEGFVQLPGGAANPSICNAQSGTCVESATNAPGPLMGFEIPRTEQSGAIVCRDDLTDPNRRRCYVWLRFEGLSLAPQAPDEIVATVSAQIRSSPIPLRYDPIGMDCVVDINSNASGGATQDLTATVHVTEWTPPSGSGGRQLQITVDSVDAQIPDGDIHIARDPVHGNIADAALCGIANLGVVKNALIPRLTGSLASMVTDQISQALGMKCTGSSAATCPAQTTCNGDGLCEDSSGQIVPSRLGVEGRLDLASLLGGLSSGAGGQADLSFIVGGHSSADTSGLTIGTLGGAEAVTPDPSCAPLTQDPRLRPGWTAPPALPGVETVDLDFDGTPETSYMLAAGLSKAILDQVFWSAYTTGLLCQSISAYQVDMLNTGSLGLLVPSIAQLTHSDLYPAAVYPARIGLHPGAEPVVHVGAGKVDRSGADPVLVDPLLTLGLHDLGLEVFAMIEERWVRLMTLTLDLDVGLGAIVTPENEVQLVLGDLTNAISNVRVTNSEILAENPADLAMSIPSLLQLALPQLAGALPSFQLPAASALGGFELDVLGIRGVEASAGVFPNIAVYANLGFDPTAVQHLYLSADTALRVAEVRVPSPEAFSVAHAGGPVLPEVVLDVSAAVPAGADAEAQVRVDGGLWSPFYLVVKGRSTIRLRRPDLLAEGHHRVEVRARVAGQYRTLDPTPAVADVVIDAAPPRLVAHLAGAGAEVEAYDVVSQDHLRLELGVGDAWREIHPAADGFVAVPELVADPVSRIAVAATDEAGHRSEVVLRAGRAVTLPTAAEVAPPTGCTCASPSARGGFGAVLMLGLALVLATRARGGRGVAGR